MDHQHLQQQNHKAFAALNFSPQNASIMEGFGGASHTTQGLRSHHSYTPNFFPQKHQLNCVSYSLSEN